MTKQLVSGIDTLVLALDVQWKDDIFFKTLQAIKEKAIKEEKDCPSIIHYRDEKEKWLFSVRPYGIRGYEWFLTSKDFSMRIGNWLEPQSRPSIMVEISSEALWRIGAKEIFERIIEIINTCGGVIVTAKISRVDLCMDILLELIEWDDFKLRKDRVCRSRKVGIFLDCETLETFQVGKDKIKVRLYDKEREIRDSSKKVWMYDIWKIKKSDIREDQRVIRVEFQIRREVIKDLGVGSAKEFFKRIDEVWSYCTKEWIKFKDNNGMQHKYRKTRDWWKIVQYNFMGVQESNPAIREKAIKIDREQLTAQLLGFASSLTALEMDVNSIDPMNFKEIEPCMIRVIENQKLTGDELNEFKENVIRKRAKYSRSNNT